MAIVFGGLISISRSTEASILLLVGAVTLVLIAIHLVKSARNPDSYARIVDAIINRVSMLIHAILGSLLAIFMHSFHYMDDIVKYISCMY